MGEGALYVFESDFIKQWFASIGLNRAALRLIFIGHEGQASTYSRQRWPSLVSRRHAKGVSICMGASGGAVPQPRL